MLFSLQHMLERIGQVAATQNEEPKVVGNDAPPVLEPEETQVSFEDLGAVDEPVFSEEVVEDTASTEGLNTPDFETMTKLELDEWAEREHGIMLDRRQTKANMIKELQEKLQTE